MDRNKFELAAKLDVEIKQLENVVNEWENVPVKNYILTKSLNPFPEDLLMLEEAEQLELKRLVLKILCTKLSNLKQEFSHI